MIAGSDMILQQTGIPGVPCASFDRRASLGSGPIVRNNLQLPDIPTATTELLQALHNAGYEHLAFFYLQGLSAHYPEGLGEISEFLYQNAWQKCNWNAFDLADSSSGEEERIGFHRAAFNSLKGESR